MGRSRISPLEVAETFFVASSEQLVLDSLTSNTEKYMHEYVNLCRLKDVQLGTAGGGDGNIEGREQHKLARF